MDLPFILLAFLAIAVAENRRAYAKPEEPITLRAGQTLVIDEDGWRVIESGRSAPAEPGLAIPAPPDTP